MGKEKDDILQKERSSRSCISDGYQLYTANFQRIFRHTWPLALVFALLSTVASSIPVLISPILLLPGLSLTAVAILLLLYASNRQLRRRGFFLPIQKIGFSTWMRHGGMLLLVLLMCLVIIMLLSLFTALPMLIMMTANWESQMGVLSGDPLGMPSYVLWLSIAAFLIAGFLQAYVWMTLLCPLYLTRASIARQEQESKRLNTKNNEKDTLH